MSKGSPASGERSEQQECKHEFDLVTHIKYPKKCLKCGREFPVKHTSEPRGQQQEWTTIKLDFGFWGLFAGDIELCREFHYEADANKVRDAHNAELAAECEWSAALYQNLDDEKKSHRRTLDALAAERQRYQALSTVHDVFCIAIRKAIGMESPMPISDMLDHVTALAARHREHFKELSAERQHREQAEARPAPITGNWIARQSENPKYPEEWDVFEGGPRGYSVIGDGFITEDQAKEIASRHNLVEQQLLSALAAIEQGSKTLSRIRNAQGNTLNPYELGQEAYQTQGLLDNVDLSALHEHAAKVREPLVEALTKLSKLCTPPVNERDRWHWTGKIFCDAVKEICDNALAKVKEGK